ncbi:MAG TPA: extracellular solute-binding protein [Beutenbergiaceae bacterium]|nr:extracellular solute-binding protein [Beutenbergiaceae bacterium]
MRRQLVSFGLVSLLALAACTGGSGTPVLTWYTNPDDGGQEAIAQACTEEADGEYRINVSTLPREASSQREQLARRLAAEDSSIDIMSLDPPFIPEFAEPGFLAEVPEELQDTDGIVQGSVESATWNEELVAVPFWANPQLLWYRTSVVEDLDLDMDKVTWEELIEAAKDNDLFIGVQGAKEESLTVWINALTASAGGEIVTAGADKSDEIELGLDSDEGRKAAEIISEIGKEGLAGAGLPTADENASMNLFQGDKGAFMVNWPFVWSAIGAANEDLLDDIGWAMYPRVDEDTESAPPVGGINLGVSAFSKNTDLAYEAVKCIVQPEHQTEYFLTDGNPPSAKEAYDDDEVKEEFPMSDLIRDSLDAAAPRPQSPFYNEISLGLQNTWHPPGAVNPDITPKASNDYITQVLRGEKLL